MKIKYTFSNTHSEHSKVFSIEDIESGGIDSYLSDDPIMRSFTIIKREPVEFYQEKLSRETYEGEFYYDSLKHQIFNSRDEMIIDIHLGHFMNTNNTDRNRFGIKLAYILNNHPTKQI